ncbi:MAG: UDP-3-O-(3-hydroxymyristoyl)glucosamine N-acyltransferase [Phycisphaerae bacterium]
MADMDRLPPTVETLAAHIGGTVVGDKNRPITRCNGLLSAGPEEISFLSNHKYAVHLNTTRAGCVLVGRDSLSINRADNWSPALIQTDDPYYSFRQILVLLHGFREHPAMGVSPLAVVAKSARLGTGVNIHPFAVVSENVQIGDNTNIYPHVTIMANARIGRDCILYPAAVVYDHCVLGDRVILQSGAVVGCDGYGFATHQGIHHKIPQIGNVVLEEDVEVGSNTVIERAAMESTLIRKGTKLGNSVVIGHNCRIGEHNLLVSQVGIAGSASTGHHVVMAGQVGVAGHLHIGDMVRVAAQSGIAHDVEPNRDIGGTPSMDLKQARRVYLNLIQLPDMIKRLREIESTLEELKNKYPTGL